MPESCRPSIAAPHLARRPGPRGTALRGLLWGATLSLSMVTSAMALPDGHGGPRRHGEPAQWSGRQAGPPPSYWHDRAHGHDHRYPRPGWVVVAPPPHARAVPWHGVSYRFVDGVWYAPHAHGYRVVRPPHGLVVPALPLLRTMVVVGGVTYLYLNGTYYRQRDAGDYEVVAPPLEASAPATGAPDRLYVYPARGQSAQQQAADEYDCHRWAARQSGFDPSSQATGGGPVAGAAQRDDYRRAQVACLEGRGYSVR